MRLQHSESAHQRPNPLEQLKLLTQMHVAAGRQVGDPDNIIRERVLNAIKEALEQDSATTQVVNLGGKPETVLNAAGTFRLVLAQPGLNRKDQRSQETWFQAVKRELEKTLRRHDGDYEPWSIT